MFSEASVKNIFDAVQRGKEPLRQFLARHAHDQDRLLFMELATRLDKSARKNSIPVGRPDSPAPNAEPAVQAQSSIQPAPQPAQQAGAQETSRRSVLDKNDFQVLIPAFVTSQLKEAFQIGFLVFVPFIIIDMVIANVLLAMGMSMLSPSVISLPFKLLLFVLVDGWFLIVRGLVLSYA
jgi:flagellar biosynthesis protein FliP